MAREHLSIELFQVEVKIAIVKFLIWKFNDRINRIAGKKHLE